MGKFLVRSMASLAEIDAERDEAAAGIGKQVHRDRTRAALVAAKARGAKLGGYRGGPVPDPMLGGGTAGGGRCLRCPARPYTQRDARAQAVASPYGGRAHREGDQNPQRAGPITG
jgi:hypothetical protein